MILGIGTDIVSVSRVKALAIKSNSKLFSKILTKEELLDLKSDFSSEKSFSFLAKRFSAKESFSKALGLGIGRGLNFKDIGVKNDQNGKPYIEKTEKLDSFVRGHFNVNDFNAHLTISDQDEYSVTFCVIEGL